MAVTKKGDKWYIVLSSGQADLKGNYKQKWVPTNAMTKTEALREENKLKERQSKGIAIDTQIKVSELFNLWMEKHVKSETEPLAQKTQEWYQDMYDRFIDPILGNRKVFVLKVLDLDDVLDQCSKKCAKNKGKDTTLRGVYATMSALFGWAKKKRLIDENLMSYVDKPEVADREYILLKPEDFPKFLEAVKGRERFERKDFSQLKDTYYTMFLLELTTALRIDELCGIRKSDLNFDEKYAKIEQQVLATGSNLEFGPTKNKKKKIIPLAEIVIDELKKELIRQDERKEKASLLWEDHGLVFTNRQGGPIDSKHLNTRVLKNVLERAGLPRMKFHNLRHSVGTALAEANEDPNAICDLMGHADPYFTKRQYIHARAKAQHRASEKLVQAVKGEK